jgi:hypothetical protein
MKTKQELESIQRGEFDGNGAIIYPVTDDALAKLRADFADIRADLDQPNYERAKDARNYCVSLRVQIEDAHAKLKRPALDYGKRVDAEKKRLIGIVTEIETRLSIQRVEDEKNRAKNEAAQAEIDRMETERVEDRRAVFEATQKAIQAREDAVRADEERVRAAAKAEADQQERERLVAEEARRVEEMRPDVAKINGFAASIRELLEMPRGHVTIKLPATVTPQGIAFTQKIEGYLEELAKRCEAFR